MNDMRNQRINRWILFSLSVLMILCSLGMGEGQEQTARPDRPVIWIGDSRCAHMEIFCGDLTVDTFIAEGGSSWKWFCYSATASLERILSEEQAYDVIVMMGVNDCFNYVQGALPSYDAYAEHLNALIERYPNTTFYFCSVNPVDEKFRLDFTLGLYSFHYEMDAYNEVINSFNQVIQNQCNATYLDCYSYLLENGFETTDGIHYTKDTYHTIYEYCLNAVADLECEESELRIEPKYLCVEQNPAFYADLKYCSSKRRSFLCKY